MKFVYTTLPRMRRVMRDRFKAETGLRCFRAARWLLNNCNDTQLANVFNKSAGAETTALKARLQAKVAKLGAWEAKKAQADALATTNEGGE